MRVRPLFLLLAVAGCSSVDVGRSRVELLNMNAPDLVACAGIPDKVQKISSNELLLEYTRSGDGAAVLNLKLLNGAFDMSLGKPGVCHALFGVLKTGEVSRVNYSGSSFSWEGPEADCAPLINACVLLPDQTALPAGYDAFDIFLPTDKPAVVDVKTR